jgi:hypothetical protein
MTAYYNLVIEIAEFVLAFAFLAIVLALVGYQVNKLILRILASRTAAKLKAEAIVAGARHRANARHAARQQSSASSS